MSSRHAMKLKYFYILCFLVSIDWSFCYEYINNEKAMHSHESIKRNPKSKQGRHRSQHRRSRRQEYEEEKDPVASIDIASFIQQPDPDYETIEDANQDDERRRASRYYDDFDSLTDMQISLEKGANARLRNDLEDSSILYGEKLSDLDKLSKNSFSSDFLHRDLSAKQDNRPKLPSRRQALPFFSRNNKEKKHEKRNFFNFGLKKASMTTLLPKCDGPKPDLKNHFNKIVKRSNFGFCPLCKRKIIPKAKKDKQKASRKNIHNSRQFYQSLGDAGQKKQKKAISNSDLRNSKTENLYIDGKIGVNEESERKKRDDDEISDDYDIRGSQHSKRGDDADSNKERQLQELEKIQKKVDSLEINFPLDAQHQKAQKKLGR